MASETTQLVYDDLTRAPGEVIAGLRAALLAGEAWFTALLRAVQRWRVPVETVGERHYVYLIGGEAFDWLLLAERLLDAVTDLVPAVEREDLIFHGRAPVRLDTETLKRGLGPVKYRAHLNHHYGITVEEALQLAVDEDVQKEVRCRAWGFDARTDETAFQRIYQKPREWLLALFREQRGLPHGERTSFGEQREFTYWLFKYRLRQCDRAKVASDTRRGLARLAQLDALRQPNTPALEHEMPTEFIDLPH
ncbi:MAG TPA: hypothetical protein VKV26_07615 [Dehalococcoidia bacterium]|nr:hypothetical protein [Dehalococcoidia bacterium]